MLRGVALNTTRTKLDALAGSHQFQTGLVFGFGAVILLLALAIASKRARESRLPLAGGLWAVAGLLALHGADGNGSATRIPLPASVTLAAVLLGAGGLVGASLRRGRLVGTMLLLVPGGIALARDLDDALAPGHGGWMVPALTVAAVAGGALAVDFDREHRRHSLGPLLFAATVAGVYLTVPETDGMRCLLGAAIPLVLLSLPRGVASLGPTAPAAFGVLLAMAGREGVARPGSVVGAIACLGIFVLEPVGRRLAAKRVRFRRDTFSAPAAVSAAVLTHVVVVVWASRFAGFRTAALEATLLLVPVLIAGTMMAPALVPVDAVASAHRRHRSRRSSRTKSNSRSSSRSRAASYRDGSEPAELSASRGHPERRRRSHRRSR